MKIATALVLVLAAGLAHAGVAFLKYERTSGMNKICVYDDYGSELAITISSVALCPLQIRTR